MPHALQELVDAFAEELGRTVTIDDKHWRVVAYSALHGDLDQLRLDALLHRDLPAAAKAWVDELGLAAAPGPVRTPANPAVGAEPRVVVPIRHDGVLLGFLTLMDAEGTLTESELRATEHRARAAGELLFREHVLDVGARGRERDLLRDLLGTDRARRDHAATALRDEGLFAMDPHVAVLVLRLDDAVGAVEPARRRLVLERGVEWLRRHARPGGALGRARADHAEALISAPTAQAARALSDGVAAALRAEHAAEPAVVGLSAPVSRLPDAHAALRQAHAAARVAARVPRFGGVATWDGLGVYRQLAGDDGAAALPPELLRLVEHDRSGVLVDTLETFLDLAGDVKATAEALALHRAGVYYRLDRIEEITGLAVRRDGEARLALHLGVKRGRLDGLLR